MIISNKKQNKFQGTNQSDMRSYNTRLIMDLIRIHKSVSKSEIAGMTGLTAQTISVIMRDLELKNYLVSGKPVKGKVGQPQVPKSINPDGAYFLGLTVGRKNAVIILSDLVGKIRFTKKIDYPYPEPPAITDFISKFAVAPKGKKVEQYWNKLAGVGISTPFQLWKWADKNNAPQYRMDAWKHYDLRSETQKYFNIPVYLENDGTSACFAELILGEKSQNIDALYYYIDYFIGGGIILNGSVYSGCSGNAGAVGSMLVPNNKGEIVQLIDIASLRNLELKLNREISDTINLAVDNQITDVWIDETANALAYSIVSANSVIDFKKSIIDGSIPEALKERIIEKTRFYLEKLEKSGLNEIYVTTGKVGYNARYLGSALLPMFNQFMLDNNQMIKSVS